MQIGMTKVHLLCSTNWRPGATTADADRMLAPLRTVLDYFSQSGYDLTKLILVGANEMASTPDWRKRWQTALKTGTESTASQRFWPRPVRTCPQN
jgi:hypothetical protein